ncbi:MAG: hypothetical protein Ct9H300mP14_06420 [Gammaproteobacteria bacterium]|nr:MAG: hypothetical protein Ct9H300mP14_06420 [Gammaproteobacteria bacterium]
MDAQTVERTAWLALLATTLLPTLKEIENALVRLPGVYQAAVRRHWPDTLEISLRRPVRLHCGMRLTAAPLRVGIMSICRRIPIFSATGFAQPNSDRHTVIDAFLDLGSSLSPLGLEVKNLSVNAAGTGWWCCNRHPCRYRPSWENVMGRGNPDAKSISLLRCSIRFCKTGCRTLNVWACVMTTVLPSSGEAAAGLVQLAAYGQLVTELSAMIKNRENNIIAGPLGIGTSKVVAIVGQVQPDSGLEIIGMGQHISKGLRKGSWRISSRRSIPFRGGGRGGNSRQTVELIQYSPV